MVWYFIGVYKINRTLHDRLVIRNFSSRVEENIFQHSKRNFLFLPGNVQGLNVWFQKISIPPPPPMEDHWKFRGGGGVQGQ